MGATSLSMLSFWTHGLNKLARFRIFICKVHDCSLSNPHEFKFIICFIVVKQVRYENQGNQFTLFKILNSFCSQWLMKLLLNSDKKKKKSSFHRLRCARMFSKPNVWSINIQSKGCQKSDKMSLWVTSSHFNLVHCITYYRLNDYFMEFTNLL